MSEGMGALAAALAKAQSEMKNAAFNKKNPHFKSSYADLAGIRDTVTPALAANGIAVVQTVGLMEGGAAVLTTRLIHAGGAEITGVYPLPANYADPQKFGSALTYARRYSLAAICNIASEEDDDGNAASQPKPAAANAAPAPTDAPSRDLSPAERAAAWAQTALGKIKGFKSVDDLDAWEARNLESLDKLADTHRDTWKLLKQRMTEARKALTAQKEAA
jgi:hypothetical protein